MTNEIIEDSKEIIETQKPIIYAGAVMRFIANIIDFVIIALGVVVLRGVIGNGFFQYILITVLFMVYFLWFWNKKQATPGKMLFGLKIVSENSISEVKKEKYLLRFIILYAPFAITMILQKLFSSIFGWEIFNILFNSVFVILVLIMLACFASIFISKKNQGLHDNLLGLNVVQK